MESKESSLFVFYDNTDAVIQNRWRVAQNCQEVLIASDPKKGITFVDALKKIEDQKEKDEFDLRTYFRNQLRELRSGMVGGTEGSAMKSLVLAVQKSLRKHPESAAIVEESKNRIVCYRDDFLQRTEELFLREALWLIESFSQQRGYALQEKRKKKSAGNRFEQRSLGIKYVQVLYHQLTEESPAPQASMSSIANVLSTKLHEIITAQLTTTDPRAVKDVLRGFEPRTIHHWAQGYALTSKKRFISLVGYLKKAGITVGPIIDAYNKLRSALTGAKINNLIEEETS